MLLLYWHFLNNWILFFLKLFSGSFNNSFSFSRNLTCSFKSSNFSKNEGSYSSFFLFFFALSTSSFQLSSFCFLIRKLFFRVPFSTIHFCNLVACSATFSKFSVSLYFSTLFPDFRFQIKDLFLFNFLLLLLVFNFFNVFFWHSFKLNNLFSFICFLKSLPRTVLFQFLIDSGFFSPMHIFNKEKFPVKKKFSLKIFLAASGSDMFHIDIGFGTAGEKSELLNSLKLLSFLLFLFTFTSWACISFIFSRLSLNLNLSNPAKCWFDSVFISWDKILKLTFLLVLK